MMADFTMNISRNEASGRFQRWRRPRNEASGRFQRLQKPRNEATFRSQRPKNRRNEATDAKTRKNLSIVVGVQRMADQRRSRKNPSQPLWEMRALAARSLRMDRSSGRSGKTTVNLENKMIESRNGAFQESANPLRDWILCPKANRCRTFPFGARPRSRGSVYGASAPPRSSTSSAPRRIRRPEGQPTIRRSHFSSPRQVRHPLHATDLDFNSSSHSGPLLTTPSRMRPTPGRRSRSSFVDRGSSPLPSCWPSWSGLRPLRKDNPERSRSRHQFGTRPTRITVPSSPDSR